VLSVLLRYTDSDYPFGIFKLFLAYKFFFLKGAFDMRLENSLIFTFVFILFSNINKYYSPGTPVSATSKADPHDIIGILLKVGLCTITIAPNSIRMNSLAFGHSVVCSSSIHGF
jgi:hypothetical protein